MLNDLDSESADRSANLDSRRVDIILCSRSVKLLARYHGINAKTYRTHAILASFFKSYNTKRSKQLAKDLRHHIMKHIMRPKKVIYPFEDVEFVLSILNLPEKIYYYQLYRQSILNSMHVNI